MINIHSDMNYRTKKVVTLYNNGNVKEITIPAGTIVTLSMIKDKLYLKEKGKSGFFLVKDCENDMQFDNLFEKENCIVKTQKEKKHTLNTISDEKLYMIMSVTAIILTFVSLYTKNLPCFFIGVTGQTISLLKGHNWSELLS